MWTTNMSLVLWKKLYQTFAMCIDNRHFNWWVDNLQISTPFNGAEEWICFLVNRVVCLHGSITKNIVCERKKPLCMLKCVNSKLTNSWSTRLPPKRQQSFITMLHANKSSQCRSGMWIYEQTYNSSNTHATLIVYLYYTHMDFETKRFLFNQQRVNTNQQHTTLKL